MQTMTPIESQIKFLQVASDFCLPYDGEWEIAKQHRAIYRDAVASLKRLAKIDAAWPSVEKELAALESEMEQVRVGPFKDTYPMTTETLAKAVNRLGNAIYHAYA